MSTFENIKGKIKFYEGIYLDKIRYAVSFTQLIGQSDTECELNFYVPGTAMAARPKAWEAKAVLGYIQPTTLTAHLLVLHRGHLMPLTLAPSWVALRYKDEKSWCDLQTMCRKEEILNEYYSYKEIREVMG